jgi:hypothetical protein
MRTPNASSGWRGRRSRASSSGASNGDTRKETRACSLRRVDLPSAPYSGNRTLIDQRGHSVSDTVEALILDLLEWIGPSPRRYAEVLEAWRTSCPRLPVWEEANDRGFIDRRRAPDGGDFISVSTEGLEYLYSRRHRIPVAADPSPMGAQSRTTMSSR